MSHEFVMPGKVITGKGALQDAENEFQTAGKKALIVSGKVMERVGNVKGHRRQEDCRLLR